MARKRQIPSVDEVLALMLDRVRNEIEGELRKVREQVANLNRKQAGMERRLARLQAELEDIPNRLSASDRTAGRRRVSPDHAQQAILEQLRAARGAFVTSRELGAPLGISRATVAARVRELRASGYEIQSSPRKGYALVAPQRPAVDTTNPL